ncbi:MAG: preprotein translocase subunit SecG [Chitinophagaceae bacterium]|nr:preprotein translocase subunit SecG [Chitinophagaceae bacterium]
MSYLFLILIVLACGVIAFFVLIQNPKGGGLAGSFGGYGNQMMGAKQSTDVVEKGTWVAATALLALILLSFIFIEKPNKTGIEKTASEKVLAGQKLPSAAPAPAPATQATPAQAAQGAQPAPVEAGQPQPAPAPAGK